MAAIGTVCDSAYSPLGGAPQVCMCVSECLQMASLLSCVHTLHPAKFLTTRPASGCLNLVLSHSQVACACIDYVCSSLHRHALNARQSHVTAADVHTCAVTMYAVFSHMCAPGYLTVFCIRCMFAVVQPIVRAMSFHTHAPGYLTVLWIRCMSAVGQTILYACVHSLRLCMQCLFTNMLLAT